MHANHAWTCPFFGFPRAAKAPVSVSIAARGATAATAAAKACAPTAGSGASTKTARSAAGTRDAAGHGVRCYTALLHSRNRLTRTCGPTSIDARMIAVIVLPHNTHVYREHVHTRAHTLVQTRLQSYAHTHTYT